MAIINGVEVEGGDFGDLPEEMKDVRVSPQTGVAALALNFALKYHDINTVQDGTLYQQYKLEGRNFTTLHLDEVFYTATQIEKHLLLAPNRLALCVLEMASEDVLSEIEDASGTEARSGETEGLDPKDDGPTAESGDAQP